VLRTDNGFTLLEVLIALGLLAVSLGGLSIRQQYIAQSLTETEKLTIATMLARKKMTETEIEFRGISFSEIKKKEEGEFEGYPGFSWERIVDDFEIKIPFSPGEDSSGELLSTETLVSKLSEIVSKHVLEVKLKIYYQILGKNREIEVVTHIVDLTSDIGLTL
jgi:prepilin-type N-terminal cleavage/methylation domain-containing protein